MPHEALETQQADAQVEARTEVQGPGYERRLSLFDGIMVVVGGIIGSGIFATPAVVAQRVDSPALILVAWAVGGALALVGALCFAELGARRPEAGGGYLYLREAFGGIFGFLYGWKLLLISATGAIAALAIIFGRYTASLFALSDAWITPLAIGALVLLTGVNYFGVRFGSITQNIFTVLKLAALAFLTVVGLLWGQGWESAESIEATSTLAEAGFFTVVAAIGFALIPVLFSHGGWQHANHIAAEIKNPNRNLPLSLILGVAIVVGTYLLANTAYLWALGVEGLAASKAPAAEAMRRLLGEWGSTVVSAGIVASVFGILNLYIMAAPRVYQAMAKDGLFFEQFANLHPEYHTPHRAILLQAAWSIILALSGTFAQLLDYVVFGDWIFFALVVATLFVYRKRDRDGSGYEGFKMIGYPVLPILFILVSVFVVYSSISSNPGNALVGTGLLVGGALIYVFWQRRPGTAP